MRITALTGIDKGLVRTHFVEDMDQSEIVLAALSTANGVTFTPVQIQKLLFLIDKRLSDETGGPHFDFEAYDYGPFDPKIYRVLESLAIDGMVEIIEKPNLRWKKYRLTPTGIEKGNQLLSSLQESAADYISRLATFVTTMSFEELVATIYKAYPEMKVNSVFRD